MSFNNHRSYCQHQVSALLLDLYFLWREIETSDLKLVLISGSAVNFSHAIQHFSLLSLAIRLKHLLQDPSGALILLRSCSME